MLFVNCYRDGSFLDTEPQADAATTPVKLSEESVRALAALLSLESYAVGEGLADRIALEREQGGEGPDRLLGQLHRRRGGVRLRLGVEKRTVAVAIDEQHESPPPSLV